MDPRQEKLIRMTTQPVRKLVLRLAGPTIASMMISSLYNMADTFFVGRMGTFATAGVGLIFPLMTVMQAFGFFFGQGSGNYVSRSLGANQQEDAEKMAATGFFCALAMGGLILLFGRVFAPPLLHLLGRTRAGWPRRLWTTPGPTTPPSSSALPSSSPPVC